MALPSEQPRRIHPERELPANLEAEGSVLGSMLLSEEVIGEMSMMLLREDFSRSSHGLLFQAILELYARGIPADVITVVEELKRRDQLDFVGGPLAIQQLVSNVTTTASASHYAKIVTDNALLRRLIESAGRILELGYSTPEDPSKAADEAGELIYKVTRHRDSDEIVPMGTLVDQAIEDLEKSMQRDSSFVGVRTGFNELDDLTAGLQAGNLIVVAARPGVGKSSFVTNLARNATVDSQTPVALFSLEMSRWEIGMRLLCGEARVAWDRIRSRTASHDDWTRIVQAAERLNDAPLYVVDSGNISIVDIRAKARLLRQREGLGMIIVDYLQLMSLRGRVESRQQEIAEISRSLKMLAKELEVPVIAVSQLNRDPERRQDKRPQLSDLRECVVGDTLVCLADGRRVRIEELVGSSPEVIAVSPEGRVVVAPTDKIWSVGVRPVFAVELASGRGLRVTGRHQLLTDHGWRRLHDIGVGDRVALAAMTPEPTRAIEWPDDHVTLLAHLVAGGDVTADASVVYRTDSPDNARVAGSAAERAFGATTTWIEGSPTGNLHISDRAESSSFTSWLALTGWASEPRRVPAQTFQLSTRQIATFLRHLWAESGVIAMDDGVQAHASIDATDARSAADVAALLQRLGILASIVHRRAEGTTAAPMVTVTGEDALARFLERVGAFGPRVAEAERAALVLGSTRRRSAGGPRVALDARPGPAEPFEARPWHPSSGQSGADRPAREIEAGRDGDVAQVARSKELSWDRVTAVAIAGEEEVFDLTVPGPASWLADGIVSHNSGAIEQDADIVMFIHREDSEDLTTKGTAELIVAKHRNGPTKMIRLAFLPSLTQFKNWAPTSAGPPGASAPPR